MAQHNQLGKEGEEAAVGYLRDQGYVICDRNWRKSHLELDIVAIDGEELVVVEVKTRSNEEMGRAEEAVTPQKIRRLVIAADTYLKCCPRNLPVRFDIITVVGEAGNFTIKHLKEAFFPPLF